MPETAVKVYKRFLNVESTDAIVELLKQDYSIGISAAGSWLLLVIASKRIFK